MKKLFFAFLVIVTFLLFTSPAFAKIRTENVDIDEGGFQYKVAYTFSTTDIGRSNSAQNVPINTADTTMADRNYYYTMPFKGSVVGISIASSLGLTQGSVTAEVTINGQITGIRTALDGGLDYANPTQNVKSGGLASHTQFNYNTIAWDDASPPDWGGNWYNADYPYGKTTPLTAGDRIGAKLISTTNVSSPWDDVVVTIIVLQ